MSLIELIEFTIDHHLEDSFAFPIENKSIEINKSGSDSQYELLYNDLENKIKYNPYKVNKSKIFFSLLKKKKIIIKNTTLKKMLYK